MTNTPTLDDIKLYAEQNGYKYVNCISFYNCFNNKNWTDRNGNPIHNWQNLLASWDNRSRLIFEANQPKKQHVPDYITNPTKKEKKQLTSEQKAERIEWIKKQLKETINEK